MSLYVSTNLYTPNELEDIFLLLNEMEDKTIGIELFPEWHNREFIQMLNKNLYKFKNHPISLHGPYYCTEHSKKKGCSDYEKSKKYFINTLKLSKKLKSKYIVYHHNNCTVTPEKKADMINYSSKNLLELNHFAISYGANIVVENAGVRYHNNMLFDEEEFIKMAKGIDNKILIDIGHAFANNWDLTYVISALKDKIVAYHLHNNDGVTDAHNRLRDGNLNIDSFFESYKHYTPTADLVLEYNKNCKKDKSGIIEDIHEVNQMMRSHKFS